MQDLISKKRKRKRKIEGQKKGIEKLKNKVSSMEGQITMDAVFTQTNVLFNNNENKSQ